jgi:nitrate reductase molybdenum cofactor assembly chaperone NarJ/NarW
MNTETYDLLALLLAYPNDETRSALVHCRALMRAEVRDAALALDRFAEQTASMTTEELQELYTQTFDLNPACSLEVGWQLYGENYSRGEFLVAMRQTLRRLRVTESTELPDHLTHVLAAFGRMETSEASRFSAEFLLPALEKMLQGLKGKRVPYAVVLEAIQMVIGIAYPLPPIREGSRTGSAWSLPLVDRSPEVCHG